MSQPLGMNLARRPFTNDILIWSGVGLLLVAVLSLSLWNGGQFLATKSQVREMTSRRQALDRQMGDAGQRERDLIREIEAARSGLLTSRATFANTIIQSHAFSWTRLFNELEKVMPLGVRLVNIRPRIGDGIHIRMNGVARNSQAFWELQDNLDAWPVFGNVYPDGIAPSASRAGVMAGELIVSLETEYFPDARLRLNLSEDEPSAVEEVIIGRVPALVDPDPAITAEPPTAGSVPAPEDSPEAAAAGEPAAPQEIPPMVRGKKRGRRGQGQRPTRGGVERTSPAPEGAPGLEKPDYRTAPRPELEGFQRPNVQSVTEDGRMLDADGNEISIEDIINLPDGIKPGPPPAEGTVPPAGARRPQGSEAKGAGGGGQESAGDGEAEPDDEENGR